MIKQQLKEGEKAPDFKVKNQHNDNVSLSDFKGRWVVLYFYPKDSTPGCTIEACGFTEGIPQFEKLEAVILGVSPDSVESHQKFIKKQNLKISLLSDPEKELCQKYGVWQQKSMMGKTYMGVVRSTFLINPEGKLAKIWADVKVNGHVDEVKKTLEELRS